MKVEFSKDAQEHLDFWQKTDAAILKKIVKLLEAIENDPYVGIGKPEPLKHELQGYWSRRITQEHRLVYRVSNDKILVVSCRFHYS